MLHMDKKEIGYCKWLNNGLTKFLKVPLFSGLIIMLLVYTPIMYLLHDDLFIYIIVIFAINGFLLLSYQIYLDNKKSKNK